MSEAALLLAAFVASYVGLAWLALAMDAHWRQVRGSQAPTRRAARTLRLLGTAGVGLSLSLCLLADYASIASLVWVMTLSAAALAVAFTFTWRPHMLAPLLAWIFRGS